MNEATFYKSKKMSITKIYRLGLIIQITTWVSPLPFEKYEKRMLAKLFYQHGKILANMLNSNSDCQIFSKFTEIFFILLIGKKIFRVKCKYLLSCQDWQAHFFCLPLTLPDIFLSDTSLIWLSDKQSWSCQPENWEFYQFRPKDDLSKFSFKI